MTPSFKDEVVDDSEPEREKWRQERKKSRGKASPNKLSTREVIELTDDESEGDQLQSIGVIDISGMHMHFPTSCQLLTPEMLDFASDSSSHEVLSSVISMSTIQGLPKPKGLCLR
jgi:hypothetical protein